jgi:translation initiation factor 2 beta subunit (eIF-2beta)/eIF-5
MICNYDEIIAPCINSKDKIEFGKIFISEFEKETKSSISILSKQKLIICNRLKPDIVIKSLLNLVSRLKKCLSCHSALTYLSKEDRIIKINCETCGSSHSFN